MVWNWLRRHPSLADAGVALLLAAGYLVRQTAFDRWWLGVPLVLLLVVPLVLRRRYPLAVLMLVATATLAYDLFYPAFVPLALGIAVYTAAAHLRRTISLAGSAAVAAAVAVVLLVRQGYPPTIPTLLGFGLAWVIGDNMQTRRVYWNTLEERAARLEREREAEAERAVAEEQARIARELHDVLAHNVSVIVMHAAAGNDAFDTRPQRAHEALQTIETIGRAALTDLRRLLGAIREDDASYQPQPGLEQIDELLARIRSSGLDVALQVEGKPQPLPVALELSAYRIIQEALTNTLKHAHASHVDVTLRYCARALDVEVRDNGRGNSNAHRGGSGLIGMRERVAAFGGSLAAGPSTTGGFAVAARFPL